MQLSPRARTLVGFAKDVKQGINDDQAPLVAAGVALFGLLALVPTLAGVVAILGLVLEPSEASRLVAENLTAVPADGREVIENQLRTVAGSSPSGLGIGLAVALVAAVWGASSAMGNVINALNVVYEERDERGFVKRKGTALVLSLGAMMVIATALAVITVVPALLSALGVPRVASELLRWPLLLLLAMGGLAVLYRYGPDHDPRCGWWSWGAIVAAVLWVLASGLFALYVAVAGRFQQTYGALGAVVVLMLWLQLTALTVLVGAEVNWQLEKRRCRLEIEAEEPGRHAARAAAA